ncbi:Hypothetical predicted protein [Lecanosticta acicola]|uniref:Uncharacterized protein n=1 Tax=Lecanosticta acicola TaxID=111012 RepID=A0AAI8Z588_9PEZI|nr:Hypothetical predicted protein [Lecanosticta acicola]
MTDIQQWVDDDGCHHHQTTDRKHDRRPEHEERNIVVVERTTHPQEERAAVVGTGDHIVVRQEGTKVHITWEIQFYHEAYQGDDLTLQYVHEPLVFKYTIDTAVNSGHGHYPSQLRRNLGPARSLPPPRPSADSFHNLENNEGFHRNTRSGRNDRSYRDDHLIHTRPRSFRQNEARPPPSAPRAMLRQRLSLAPSSRGDYFSDDRAHYSEEGEQDGYSSRGDSRYGVGSERGGSDY